MQLAATLGAIALQTLLLLYAGGKWQGRFEEKIRGLAKELDEHKALSAFRAHG